MEQLTTGDSQALSERLTSGWLPVSEAVGYAMQLGVALRSIHQQGQIHGALTPDMVILTGSGLQLLPSTPDAPVTVTSYTAPERLQGQAPDACADIFAFGAMFYEMLTGLRPFEGETPEALAESILNSVPAPIGQRKLDRLISTCLFKNPAARWQSMQQVLTELGSLLPSETTQKPAARHSSIRSRTRMRQNEQHKLHRMAELQRAAADEPSPRQTISLQEISEELSGLRLQFAEAHERATRAEEKVEETRLEMAGGQTESAVKIRDLYQQLEEQAYALETVRMGMEKTEALVEQVVDALGSLQSLVLDAIGSMPQVVERPVPVAASSRRAIVMHQQTYSRSR